jgi:mono/diheme cytochrome c family protein
MITRKARSLTTACALVLALSACNEAKPSLSAAPQPSVEHGRYIAKIGHCGGCHNADAPGMPPKPENYLAGRDIGFSMPDSGIVYARNLTPDPNYGLGKWSLQEIITAFRTGVRPDGRVLQVMPWRDYGVMNDYDAMSLALYLKSMPPNPHHVTDLASIESATTNFGLIVSPDEAHKILADRAPSHGGH